MNHGGLWKGEKILLSMVIGSWVRKRHCKLIDTQKLKQSNKLFKTKDHGRVRWENIKETDELLCDGFLINSLKKKQQQRQHTVELRLSF